ncbi:hypothetical protein [Gimesia fumaroli]|uniref:Uncharacterized protein n=1 Tax=Gimesia fumaroli TaxID=2527976 RepID=A0A518I587_9PLAN|nr:hypothetical protein [Gimesia fumaroli]QDV48237.1 hypothetical protein Enr17x_02480 [Gimesia fumaroli]
MSASYLSLFRLSILLVSSNILFGCAEERPAVPQPSAEYVVVLDEQGTPSNILFEQFFKQQDHSDGVKVMVIDRQRKGKALIPPAELLKQNPNAGRYLIFKHDDLKRPFDDLPDQQ